MTTPTSRNRGTLSDHTQRAEQFRASLRAEAAKPAEERLFPENPAEWVSVVAAATCRTPGCAVDGVPFQVRVHENADGVYRTRCGRCAHPHPELVAVFDDDTVNLAPQHAREAAPPVKTVGDSAIEGPG